MQMATRWKLKEFLSEHNISVYELAKHTKGRLSRNGLYKLVNKSPEQLRIATLDTLIPVLGQLTGKDVGLSDILEWQNEADYQP